MHPPLRPPSNRTVGIAVGALIVLTLFHFTDNFVNVEDYPRSDWQSETFIRVGALVTWPLFAAFGVIGYRDYRRGKFPHAHIYLVASSYLGLISLLHFTAASPDELTTRGLVSVLIDGAVGAALLGVTVWSIVARRRESSLAPAHSEGGAG
jgi:hypothetical protein